MKKLPAIGDAFLEMEWEEEDRATADYRFLEQLHRDGHHPIQVGRSTFVIEQCEDGDPVPHLGAAGTALRITVHGDKDIHPYDDVFYIWGGRYGMASGGLYGSDGTKVDAKPFGRYALARDRDVVPAIRMLLDGARNRIDHLPWGADGKPVADERYRELRQNAIEALEALAAHVGARYGR